MIGLQRLQPRLPSLRRSLEHVFEAPQRTIPYKIEIL